MASVAPELPLLARDQAFERLYRSYVKDVYHYALALLRNPADAEDVTQTTFMNAYRAFQKGQQIEKPQNWLIKIAHNVARTRYARASRRVKEVPLEDHVEQLAVPEEERPNVEGVLRALGRLPFNQRAALVMRELEGRSYAEIAETLDVSVAAVETLIFRARRSLKIRSSALRAITAVPVPGSLAGLFEGGAVVGGGGALGGGTALLAKTAVALVAGALATGLGGDRAGRATAAPAEQAAQPRAAATSLATVQAKRVAVVTKRAGGGALPQARKAAVKRKAGSTRAVAQPHIRLQTAPTAAPAAVDAPQTRNTAAPVSATERVTRPVTEVVDTVEETVAAVVPPLPVEVPATPTLPVEVPKVPKLP